MLTLLVFGTKDLSDHVESQNDLKGMVWAYLMDTSSC